MKFFNGIKTLSKKIKLRHKKVKFMRGALVSLTTYYEGGNVLGYNSYLPSSVIGYGSYIGNDTVLTSVKIGKYVSIGAHVTNVLGEHPTKNWVSTHPAFFSTFEQAGFSYVDNSRFEEIRFVDKDKRFVNEIGNDVWIGQNVLILDGVKIGDGAIIGAGSVVTKDVPDYAIVTGIPAKVSRYRFNADDISFLKKIEWWNRNEEWIRDNADNFDDINKIKKLFM